MIWINTYLPDEDVEVEILTKEDKKERAIIQFVYDSEIDPSSTVPKWYVDRLEGTIELRNVIAWRIFHS